MPTYASPSAGESTADPGTALSRHMPALDGLRGLAVVMVFCYHYAGGARSGQPVLHALGTLNQAGWAGVTLFFVLSGFLITGILWDSFGNPHWVRNFYMRRMLRIFPLYYFVVLLVLAAGAWQHAFVPGARICFTLATFTQNLPYFQTHGKVPAPIFHLWSIATEEQFYLVWPWLLFLVRRSRHAMLLPLGLFAACCLYRVLLFRYAATPELYLESLLVRGGELAAGATLALALRSALWPAIRRAAPAVGIACVAVFAATALRAHSFQLAARVQWVYGLPALTIAFAALLVVSLSPGVVQRAASAPALRFCGRISYGIYVFHFLLLHNVNQAAASLAHARQGTAFELVRLAVAIVATATASMASFYLLERPFLRLKRRFPSQPALPVEARPTLEPL